MCCVRIYTGVLVYRLAYKGRSEESECAGGGRRTKSVSRPPPKKKVEEESSTNAHRSTQAPINVHEELKCISLSIR